MIMLCGGLRQRKAPVTRTDVLAFSLHFANAFAYRHRVRGKRIVIARQTPLSYRPKKAPATKLVVEGCWFTASVVRVTHQPIRLLPR
jgi:hypothetical protein